MNHNVEISPRLEQIPEGTVSIDDGKVQENGVGSFVSDLRNRSRLVMLLVATLASAPGAGCMAGYRITEEGMLVRIDTEEMEAKTSVQDEPLVDVRGGCDNVKLHIDESQLIAVAATRKILNTTYGSIKYDHQRSFLSNLETLMKDSLGILYREDVMTGGVGPYACLFLAQHGVPDNIGQFDRMSFEHGYVILWDGDWNELQRLDVRKAFYIRDALPRTFRKKADNISHERRMLLQRAIEEKEEERAAEREVARERVREAARERARERKAASW